MKVAKILEGRYVRKSDVAEAYYAMIEAEAEVVQEVFELSAKTLEIVERQKIVRLVIKQIIVNGDTLTIHHSIPISRSSQQSQPSTSYLLCTRSPFAVAG